MRSFTRRLAPVVLLGATVLATVRCYGPTEVTLDLSTDLSCADKLTTRVYKGGVGVFDSEPETETPSCAAEPTGARIGTLVVVPSAGPDGRAGIKAVLARNGKSPADCTSDLTDCIVATRAFSFVEHASRRVPIRFLQDCLGTSCPDGQTCISGGRCVSDQVTCDGPECALPEEIPRPLDGGGPGLDDGGTLDASSPDVRTPPNVLCVAPNGGDTLATSRDLPGANRAAASAGTLFFVRSDAPTKVVAVSKAGKGESAAFETAAGGKAKVTAIAADQESVAVAYDDLGGVHKVKTGQRDLVVPTSSSSLVALAAAGDAAFYRVYASTSDELWQLGDTWEKLPVALGATRMAVDGTALYVTSGGTASAIARASSDTSVVLASSPKNAAFGTDDVQVVAGGESSTQLKGALAKLALTGATPIKEGFAEIPKAVAVDAQFVYFVAGASIFRVAKDGNVGSSGPTRVVEKGSGAVIDHLAADPGVGGCLYFWMKASAIAEAASLVVTSKTPLAITPDAGAF